MLTYQLLRPAAYLFINDKQKWKIDWLLPILITASLLLVFGLLPEKPKFFIEDGIISRLQGFLQILPGFYLAALAAVATFDKKDLDTHMPDPIPQIELMYEGHKTWIKLTRRRMLCFLFGYLTFLSLCLYLFTIGGNCFYDTYKTLSSNIEDAVTLFAMPLFMVFFWQMINITFFGLYQLCDRIHVPSKSADQ